MRPSRILPILVTIGTWFSPWAEHYNYNLADCLAWGFVAWICCMGLGVDELFEQESKE